MVQLSVTTLIRIAVGIFGAGLLCFAGWGLYRAAWSGVLGEKLQLRILQRAAKRHIARMNKELPMVHRILNATGYDRAERRRLLKNIVKGIQTMADDVGVE
jgi:hypothetical protein